MIGYIILSLFVIILSWTTFNLTRKVERLETWIEDYAQRVINTQETLKVIVKDYYFSNVIARSSKTMIECNNSKINIKYTGTEG